MTNKLIEDFLAEQRTHNADGTVRKKRSDLSILLEWIDEQDDVGGLLDLTPRAFRRFITDSINEGIASTTAYNRYNSATTFYQWLADVGEPVPTNADGESTIAKRIGDGQRRAMRGRSKKEESGADYYLPAEGPESVETLVEHAPNPKLRNQLLIRLMFACGFRIGEAVSIELEHINIDKREVTVRNLKGGDRFRTNWFGGKVEPLARAWLRTGRPDVFGADSSEYLFPSSRSDHVSEKTIARMIKRAAEDAGMQGTLYVDSSGKEYAKITSHVLRHSYGVHCIQSGMDVKTLMELMGHTNIEVTMGYLRYRKEDLRNAARKFNP